MPRPIWPMERMAIVGFAGTDMVWGGAGVFTCGLMQCRITCIRWIINCILGVYTRAVRYMAGWCGGAFESDSAEALASDRLSAKWAWGARVGCRGRDVKEMRSGIQ
jgi:hypothetical protein